MTGTTGRLARVGCVLALLVAPAGRAAGADGVVMKLATVAPEGTPWAEGLERFKLGVETATGKRIRVKLYYGGTLGDENETVRAVKVGQLQAVAVSTGALATELPALEMVELPFLFNDEHEADRILDSVITRPVEKACRDHGLTFGFWSENGYRSFGTRDKFVKSPADLAGKKMRSQESPVHVAMWKAFGAEPITLPTTEVYQSVKSGIVDGFDQTPLYMAVTSWHKTIRFFTLSNHIYQPAAIVFNRAWFEALPKESQVAILAGRDDLQKRTRKAVRKMNRAILDNLKADGLQIYTPTRAERGSFAEAARKVRADWKSRQSKDIAALLTQVETALSRK